MAFLAPHAARLSQREPRWLLLTHFRLAALVFALNSSLLFGLCGYFLRNAQWVTESQYMSTTVAYMLIAIGVRNPRSLGWGLCRRLMRLQLGLSVLVNLVHFVMLYGKWHYLLPAGANVGVECLVWTVMVSMGIAGGVLFDFRPGGRYCPLKYKHPNDLKGYEWCMENWDRIKMSERAGMVFCCLSS
jgi:hypothetical protein